LIPQYEEIVMSSTQNPENDKTTEKRVIRNLIISGVIMVLALVAGFWSAIRHEASVLIVTSRPSGAEIVLNRRPTKLITNAFFAGLPADSFVVSVRQDGFRPVPPEQGVSLKPNDTTRVTFLMSPISREDTRQLPVAYSTPYRWEWRQVRFNSEPEGAEVIVDEVHTGMKTPCDFLFEPGKHHLQANWPNGAKDFKNITVDPAQSHPEVIFKPVTYVQPEDPQVKQ
jgi:hypothetical protein